MNNRIRLLFLDDSRARHAALKNWITIFDAAFSCDEAISMISAKKYDVLSLDHDLSDEDQMTKPGNPTKERTGSDFAAFVAANKIFCDVIILHSYNDAGANNMANILKGSARQIMRVPFGFNAELYRSLADAAK